MGQDRRLGLLWSSRALAWAVCVATVAFVAHRAMQEGRPASLPARVAEPAAGERPPEAVGPAVSVADLLAKAKQQERAEGLAALEPAGAAAAAPAGLAAPAAPKSFGGAAISEAAPAEAETNESLQQDLERQKARLGIRRVIAPNPVVRALTSALHSAAPGAESKPKNEAIRVEGFTAALLSPEAASGTTTTRAALVSPEDFSGSAPRRTSQPLGAPLPAPEAQEAGRAVYSMEEATLLWRERGLEAPCPRVDFAQEMLVVVFGQARLGSITTAGNRIMVRYDPSPAPGSAAPRWRVLPRSELPVLFEPAP